MKKNLHVNFRDSRMRRKLLIFMKLSLILTMFLWVISAQANGQKEGTFSLKLTNVAIENVFREIEKTSNYRFIYQVDDVKGLNQVSLDVNDADINTILTNCFKDSQLEYVIENDYIVIRKSKEVKTVQTVEVSVIEIKGKVTDKNGYPLPGATVLENGTLNGVTTDVNGNFSIKVRDALSELKISFIGFTTQSIVVGDKISFNIVLEESETSLGEVVVIGYGTSTRKELTASVSSVTAADIAKQPVSNLLTTLQGQMSGAVITQSNGLPGSRVNIEIRGTNSISSGTQPLYIIDGIPFNIYDQSVPPRNDLNSFGILAANGGISPFSMINPSDIERIDVLKDADATAIYGTKGANGVVLITTKKGKAGKTKVDLNVYQGFGTVSNFIDMMNLEQYLNLRREALSNDGLTPGAGNAPDLVTWDQTKSTDWQKKYLGGTAKTTDAQLTVSGGDTRTRFLLAAGYRDESTVYPGDFGSERISTRFSADHNSLDRKFFASISSIVSYDKTNLLATDLSSTYNLPPNLPLYNENGSLYWDNNFTNPEAFLFQKYIGETNNLSSNISLRYTLLPGLDLKTSIGYNKVSTDQNQQTPISSQRPNTSPTNNARFAMMDQQSYIIEPQAVYTRDISKGKLTALAGATWQHARNKSQSIDAKGYSSPELLGDLTGASSYSITSTRTLYRYNSIFGRLTYNWDSKYIINANLRRDGSSRFGSNHKWGTFWSLGGAWIFTGEKIIADALPLLSFGKLRLSYGLTGNDQIQDYQWMATLTSGSSNYSYQGTSIVYPSGISNPNLHWETNKKLEVGLDLNFMKDRVVLTANYYRNRSDNQLSYLALAIQAGFNSYTGNMPALLQNKGFELEVSTRNVVSNDLSWRTSFNITIPQNKLLEVDPSYYYASTYTLGKSINQVKRYEYMGVDQETGKPLYKNQTTGESTFSPSYSTDRILAGDTDPEFYGGITNTITYKGFEMNFTFRFKKQDGNIYPTSGPGIIGNQTTYWLNRWQEPGDNSSLGKATTFSNVYSYTYSGSSAPWGDNSFIKLQNVTLSYTFPSALLEKYKISNLRVYMQAQNLLTWTKNKYAFDPETGTSMPALQIITFGLNCSF
ncbi:MAG: SusC/RagA family TonB-linked outer membrane protein [Bacteroidetes bacterium HGW-Bacteroidetes-17]|nr:MAG: SusC/RagA family TonB-linked outer membrane protein [Bacteroidetes bacterium HGW-Bacteroidetes-17]